ncbi:MAG: sulfur carrier protein ThiS [Deltaproteobacteria bacterium]|nr:sulfur carrier protein ThiS [Deltaproteobacteria bacterium]MCL5892966.1 sulfur carrier protein ThiS [Deltaproteobacteria bacterium]
MKIDINGKEFDVSDVITVQNLIDELKLDIKSTAVAVNKTIVSKSGYREFLLNESDKVDLVTIAPGG